MTAANQDQQDYWNGPAGHAWVAAQARLDAMLAPVTEALLDLAAPRGGERVVDVGCGCGDTTIAAARRGAAVWGIDLSEPMLAHAKARAAGMQNLAFSRTDAANQTFTPDHQLVLSRFGLMFFDDPDGAFANLRSALAEDGRLVFSAWQAPSRNPWVSVAGRAVAPCLPEPAAPPDPRAPGPFAFADADYLAGILDRAGFREVRIEPFETTVRLADDVAGALEFLLQVGPLARVLEDLEPEPRSRAMAAVGDALEAQRTDAGIRLGAACWLVHARPG